MPPLALHINNACIIGTHICLETSDAAVQKQNYVFNWGSLKGGMHRSCLINSNGGFMDSCPCRPDMCWKDARIKFTSGRVVEWLPSLNTLTGCMWTRNPASPQQWQSQCPWAKQSTPVAPVLFAPWTVKQGCSSTDSSRCEYLLLNMRWGFYTGIKRG